MLQRGRACEGAEIDLTTRHRENIRMLQRGRACEGAEIFRGVMASGSMPLLQRGRACEGAEIWRWRRMRRRTRCFNGAAPVRARN